MSILTGPIYVFTSRIWPWCAVTLSVLAVLLAAAFTIFTVIGAVESHMRQPYAIYTPIGVYGVVQFCRLTADCWENATHRKYRARLAAYWPDS